MIFNYMETLTRICPICDNEFTRKAYEIMRVERRNKTSLCSRACSAAHNNFNRKGKPLSESQKSALEKFKGNKFNSDEFTGLRRMFSHAMRRDKEFNLTLDHLLDVWLKQKGICVYSNVQLIKESKRGKPVDPRYKASLDRIDPSKGYIIGNVQFTSSCMNYAKATLTHKEMIELLKLIKEAR